MKGHDTSGFVTKLIGLNILSFSLFVLQLFLICFTWLTRKWSQWSTDWGGFQMIIFFIQKIKTHNLVRPKRKLNMNPDTFTILLCMFMYFNVVT